MRAHMNKIEETGRPPLSNARRSAAYCLGSAFMAAAATAALSHPLISQRGMDGWMCVCITHHCDGVQRVDYGEEQNVVQLICFRPATRTREKRLKFHTGKSQKRAPPRMQSSGVCACRCVTAPRHG